MSKLTDTSYNPALHTPAMWMPPPWWLRPKWLAAGKQCWSLAPEAAGKGVFALDITNPTSFGPSNVLWEFTDAHDPDMGNVVGTPKS